MNTLRSLTVLRLAAALGVCVVGVRAQEVTVDLTPRRTVVDGVEMFALGFDKLSAFDYTLVDAGTGATPEEIEANLKKDPVPPWIRTYDKQRVRLTGYLMPLQVQNGRTKKFVMMRDVNTCCYGAVPRMNDYLVVTMTGDGVEAIQDVPVELVGIFHIDHRYEDGYVVSLFRMDGEKFLGPKK